MFLQIVTTHPNPINSFAENGVRAVIVRSDAGFFVGPFQSEEARESFKNAWLKDWVSRRGYNANQAKFALYNYLPDGKTAIPPEGFGSVVGFRWYTGSFFYYKQLLHFATDILPFPKV